MSENAPHTVAEVAKLTGFSPQMVTRLFENKPGVLMGAGSTDIPLRWTWAVKLLLEAAETICPEYRALFLMAVRAEVCAVANWSRCNGATFQFGKNDMDPNQFILVQNNYVRREHTTTKSKKSRRVDLSRELRRELIDVRDQRLLSAFQGGNANISDQLVFLSSTGTILDPDNLYHRYFLPVLTKSGLRKIRFHDLRHTLGSLLIQSGASIVYVKEQLGHSSIQVTVDTYGHD